MAHWIASSLTFRMPTLLRITEWSVWPSSENWHLHDKLRHSYGDLRLLHEAPGHLFLEHDSEDLASFLQIAMLNGWGGYILTQADYVNGFFSHDECIDFFAELDSNLLAVRKELGISRSDRIRVPPDARPQGRAARTCLGATERSPARLLGLLRSGAILLCSGFQAHVNVCARQL